MHSHYAAIQALPSQFAMSLEAAFEAAEENLWDDDDPLLRPAVPGEREQVLDTDYDPDPAQEATPLKNESPQKAKSVPKKPAKKH